MQETIFDSFVLVGGTSLALQMASIKEIAAMKLNAIAGRGSKKDFIDLYYILQKYNLSQLLDFYKVKYQDGSDFMVLKSLSYFDDADLEQTPLIFQDITWDEIKAEIIVQVRAVS
jgi:predicted nucleotidyltransferase component of viral defense system